MRITDEYRDANQALHASNLKYGTSGAKWAGKVSALVRGLDTRTVLDYGCGKGLLAAALPELNIREYAPAIAGLLHPRRPGNLIRAPKGIPLIHNKWKPL